MSQGKTIDLSKLATNAQKVAYAVVLQDAQDEVILTESTLKKTRKTIAKTQESLNRNLEMGGDLVESYKADLKELKFQEKFCVERAEAACQNLDKLVRQSRNGGEAIKIKISPKSKA